LGEREKNSMKEEEDGEDGVVDEDPLLTSGGGGSAAKLARALAASRTLWVLCLLLFMLSLLALSDTADD